MIEVAKNITLSGERVQSILYNEDMYFETIENNVMLDRFDGDYAYFKLVIKSTETDQLYATDIKWRGGDLVDEDVDYDFYAVKVVKKSVVVYKAI